MYSKFYFQWKINSYLFSRVYKLLHLGSGFCFWQLKTIIWLLKLTCCSLTHYDIYFSNGIQISHKIANATGKAKKKGIKRLKLISPAPSFFVAVVKVQKWVVNFTFSSLAIPLVLLAFVFLLHPHREIQAGPPRLSTQYCWLVFLFLDRCSAGQLCSHLPRIFDFP